MYQVIQNEEKLINWLGELSNHPCSVLNSKQIKSRLLQSVLCLDSNYGTDRNLKSDLGGYLVVLFGDSIEIQREYKKIIDYYHLDKNDFEYEDKYQEPECFTTVTFRLYLCSSDYAVEIVTVITEEIIILK